MRNETTLERQLRDAREAEKRRMIREAWERVKARAAARKAVGR